MRDRHRSRLRSLPKIGSPRGGRSEAARIWLWFDHQPAARTAARLYRRFRARFDHIDAVVSGLIEDELSSKTIHNAVTLFRTILAGKKGPSAIRRGLAFHDPRWASNYRRSNPVR